VRHSRHLAVLLYLLIPALILGYQAKSEIHRAGGVQSRRGMAIAGIVRGWVGVGLFVVLVVVFFEIAASCSNTDCGLGVHWGRLTIERDMGPRPTGPRPTGSRHLKAVYGA
jgi:hypothetical protein